jgi:long-chain acyl-CoA synthetase
VGIPFPDTDAKIVDPEDWRKELPVGEEGELIVKGPQVMLGYWNKPEENAETLKDGWLLTGDIARMDEDGYFYIVDRKKDLIIAGGYNIYPREVDEVLFAHPKVLEAITIGVPHEYRGETVKVFVVAKPGETLTEEEIVAYCKENLAAYKVPKLVEFRDELPKTAVGKVLRKELRAEELKKAGGEPPRV